MKWGSPETLGRPSRFTSVAAHLAASANKSQQHSRHGICQRRRMSTPTPAHASQTCPIVDLDLLSSEQPARHPVGRI